MGKNFDEPRAERERRERSFTITGREFHFLPALPAETYSLYLELMDKMSEGHWPTGSFDVLNGTILELLDPAGRAEWEAALANGSGHPISFEDMAGIIDYCVDVTTGRPTEPRSPSGTSGGSGGTTSTGGSGLQEAPGLQVQTSAPS